jgi:hypothetical protein
MPVPAIVVTLAPLYEDAEGAIRRINANLWKFAAVFTFLDDQNAPWPEYERVYAKLAAYLNDEPRFAIVLQKNPGYAEYLEQTLIYAYEEAALPDTRSACVHVLDRYFL